MRPRSSPSTVHIHSFISGSTHLEVGEEGEDESRYGSHGDQRAVVIVHEGGGEKVESVRPDEERDNCRDGSRESCMCNKVSTISDHFDQLIGAEDWSLPLIL